MCFSACLPFYKEQKTNSNRILMHRKIVKHSSIEEAKYRRKKFPSEDVNYSSDYIQRTFETSLYESNRTEYNFMGKCKFNGVLGKHFCTQVSIYLLTIKTLCCHYFVSIDFQLD